MLKKPRINKTKEQIIAETKHLEKVNREKSLVKLIYPFIENQKTIYDAQTVLQALSGFIKAEIDRKSSLLFVKDLNLDLSKEKDSAEKTAVVNLIGLMSEENAKESASLLERFGNILAQYSSREYMKNPMKDITIDKIVAS